MDICLSEEEVNYLISLLKSDLSNNDFSGNESIMDIGIYINQLNKRYSLLLKLSDLPFN